MIKRLVVHSPFHSARLPAIARLAAVAAPLMGLGLSGCGPSQNQQAAAPPPSVPVAHPIKRTVTDWDEFSGRFDAVEQVQIRARVPGFVTGVEFKDGAFVKAGDLLYTIDPRQYQAVAAQAQGQLQDAKAHVELAKRELERAPSLIKTDAVSHSVVAQRTQQLQTAQASALQAEGVLQ